MESWTTVMNGVVGKYVFHHHHNFGRGMPAAVATEMHGKQRQTERWGVARRSGVN